jgi:Holliday junction resolvase RusA-like endonuclease
MPRNQELVLTFHIPKMFPSGNELAAAKAGRWKGEYNQMKKQCQATVAKYAPKGMLPKGPFRWVFTLHEWDGRRDVDNAGWGASKMVLDALQELGVIPDDNRHVVCDIVYHLAEAISHADVGVTVSAYRLRRDPPEFRKGKKRLPPSKRAYIKRRKK